MGAKLCFPGSKGAAVGFSVPLAVRSTAFLALSAIFVVSKR